jgi:hypothetical protein
MNYGIQLEVSDAIASTNGNEVETINIWEAAGADEDRHLIQCSVWEFTGVADTVERALDGTVHDLRPHGGRCHSFQYRYELWDDDAKEWDLDESDEANSPQGLLRYVPNQLQASAAATLNAWLESHRL